MLQLAQVTDGDVVYDLGSGDGRIVITAARRYGVKAVGFEIDPSLVKASRDNIKEAGLEHLSRLTTKNVDLLLIVSDPSFRGVQAARRVFEVAKSLKIVAGKAALIINRLTNGIPPRSQEEIDSWGLPLAGTVPDDPLVAEFDGLGKPTINLPADSVAVKAVNDIFNKLV